VFPTTICLPRSCCSTSAITMSFGVGVGDFIALSDLALSTWAKFRDAPEQFSAIRTEVAGLYSVLSLVAKTIPQGGDWRPREKDLSSIVQGCRDILTKLDVILKKNDILGNGSQNGGSRAQKAWKRFKWDQTEIQELRSRIVSNTSLLNIFTANLASEQAQAALLELDKRVEDVQMTQSRQEHRMIAEWLSPINFPITHNDICSRRQQGTGLWLLNSPEYQDWIYGTDDVLWCPGIRKS